MGKGRKTAKTGDKKLYKNRNHIPTIKKTKIDDDDMYDEVDRHHNEREKEFLSLSELPEDVVDDDGYADKEAVLDLGVDASDSESEEEFESEAEEQAEDNDSDEETPEASSDEDFDDEMENEDVMDWGKRQSSYFGGDTADLEIGQDEEDAFLEEEAAKEVQKERFKDMDEDDFMLSDIAGNPAVDSDKDETQRLTAYRDFKNLPKSTRRKLLQSGHPEFLPLINHFSSSVRDWGERTRIVADALFWSKDVSPKDVGATNNGLDYLLTKAMLQASCALNVAGYLLLKSELANKERTLEDPMLNINPDSEIKSHPVIRRLQQLNKLNIKLEENIESKVPSLSSELDSLLRAASLMKEKFSDEDSDSNEEFQDENFEILEKSMITNLESKSLADSISPLVEKREDKEVTLKRNHEILNDARFGLRQKELLLKAPAKPSSFVASDFGDDDADITSAANASKSLASTINSIQQRSTAKSRKSAHRSEDIDNQGENEVLERGLAMMEADIGLSDDDNDEDKDNIMEDDDFYSRVKKRRENEIERKKQLYSVAPKYPVVEEEIDGERAISKTILKNRGLVPHKAKINRNPRVKKREQYRKALIRRKGAVREVRTNEAHNYGGEATGVKATISRSRKLSSR